MAVGPKTADGLPGTGCCRCGCWGLVLTVGNVTACVGVAAAGGTLGAELTGLAAVGDTTGAALTGVEAPVGVRAMGGTGSATLWIGTESIGGSVLGCRGVAEYVVDAGTGIPFPGLIPGV